VGKNCVETDRSIFVPEISSGKQSPKKANVLSGRMSCVTCIAPKNGLSSALQEGQKKANPREAHNQGRTKLYDYRCAALAAFTFLQY
jgi:hypothetical protein